MKRHSSIKAQSNKKEAYRRVWEEGIFRSHQSKGSRVGTRVPGTTKKNWEKSDRMWKRHIPCLIWLPEPWYSVSPLRQRRQSQEQFAQWREPLWSVIQSLRVIIYIALEQRKHHFEAIWRGHPGKDRPHPGHMPSNIRSDLPVITDKSITHQPGIRSHSKNRYILQRLFNCETALGGLY